MIKRLEECNFTPLLETDLWRKKKLLKRGGKYYFTRNGSSIVAFIVGGNFQPGNGFKIIGAHTDSPSLKLKPRSKKGANSGLIQLNVESYGGGLWHTWFDRDLSIAGRVIVRRNSGDGMFEHRLVKINRPILRIPNLCIHLRSPEEREAFKVNKEDHLAPILCEEVDKSLSSPSSSSSSSSSLLTEQSTDAKTQNDEDKDTDKPDEDLWKKEQQSELLNLISKELDCEARGEEVVDFELTLYDTQGASTGGLNDEFLCSSRLDNLASCFVALEALETQAKSDMLVNDEDVSMIALFDHEEVGSGSNPGAGSTLMRDAVQRISNALDDSDSEDSEIFKAGLAKSLILSVDMAHAVHPNYASKHEKNHSPKMNSGIVIKSNNNQRYATNGVTGFIVRELGRRSGVPVQEFAVRNDCPCGSTIGPVISANTGIRAVDLGMPQLSMHSIREMMGGSDLNFAHALFTTFFRDFRSIDDSLLHSKK